MKKEESIELTKPNLQVNMLPFPLTSGVSSRGVSQLAKPNRRSSSAVLSVIWTLEGKLNCSMRLAVLTVSPNNWNLAFSPLRTPCASCHATIIIRSEECVKWKCVFCSYCTCSKLTAVTGPEFNPILTWSSAVEGPSVLSRSLHSVCICRQMILANQVATTTARKKMAFRSAAIYDIRISTNFKQMLPTMIVSLSWQS